MSHRSKYSCSRYKSELSIKNEVKIKGFSFNEDCKRFIITNHAKAYQWAYDLGLEWTPEKNSSIYDWFFSFFEPSGFCLKYFKQDYLTKARYFSKQDNIFYLYLIISYFRGLKASGLVDMSYLIGQWQDMRYQAINYFYIKPKNIPESI